MRRNVDNELRALERRVRGGDHSRGMLVAFAGALVRSGAPLGRALDDLAVILSGQDDDELAENVSDFDADSVVTMVDSVALDLERQHGVPSVVVTNDGLVAGHDKRYLLVRWAGDGKFDHKNIAAGVAFWDPVSQVAVVVDPASGGQARVRQGVVDANGLLEQSEHRWNWIMAAAQAALERANDDGREDVSHWLVDKAVEGWSEIDELYGADAMQPDSDELVPATYMQVMTALDRLGVTPSWSIYAPGPPDPEGRTRQILREDRDAGW